MLIYVEQDIFQSPAQVIVNTVNTVGVMGKGIAKRYKNVFPDMFKHYKYLCENHAFDVGELWLYESDSKWILNFPTKKHWRNSSKIEYIEAGLQKFVETYAEKNITSISFPQLGCGNGRLDWLTEVKPLMEKYLKKLPIDIYIHLYKQNQDVSVEDTKKILKQNPQLLGMNQLWTDLKKVRGMDSKVVYDTQTWNVSLPAYNEEMSLELQELGEAMTIKNHQKEITIYESDIQDIWLKLRDYGYLLPYDLPNHIQLMEENGIIFELLKKVDYIEEVKLANTNYQITIGLTVNRLKIPSSLIEEPMVVEASRAS